LIFLTNITLSIKTQKKLAEIITFIVLKKLLIILLLTAGVYFSGAAQDRFNALSGAQLKYYPNPASSFINFDFQRSFDNTATLQIYNFLGKKVYEIKNMHFRNYLNLEEFYRGVYIFQLRDKNGQILESGKFQVVK